jgi:hypothetical protein
MSRLKSFWATWVGENLVLRVAAFYALFFAAAYLLARLPGANPWTVGSITDVAGIIPGSAAAAVPERMPGSRNPAFDAAVAMITAALLMLPVAWLYIVTRKKKGYTQSVVQTLIILTAVVAGVVVLVKESLALAFSLAGIVAAVRFRTTIEDSKDAVYIFLSVAIGLAAGVQLSVAVVSSVVFNLVVLALWYTDFGRSPGTLEGTRAARRLKRALETVSRTGTFVARLDEEVFKSMSPEQLDALADRAWRRKMRNAPDLIRTGEHGAVQFQYMLRVRTGDVDEARHTVEFLLDECVGRWKYGGVVHESDGTHFLEYGVELKPDVPADKLIHALGMRGGPHVIEAKVK